MEIKIKILYHVCAKNQWREIVTDQISKMHFSGLYDACEGIYCGISGRGARDAETLIRASGKKFHILSVSPDDLSYERLTLLGGRPHVTGSDVLLYLHTKGVTRPDEPHCQDWRRYMEFVLMRHWTKCVEKLGEYDVVGVNLSTKPALHFSGNFWWTRGDYYLRLPDTIGPRYHDTEMYLCSLPDVRAMQMDTSGNVNHYLQPYPLQMYCDRQPTMVLGGSSTTILS